MILSNESLQKALASGRIIIDPSPAPLRPTPGATSCPFQTSAVDLRLGTDFSEFNTGNAIAIDLSKGSFLSVFANNSASKTVAMGDVFTLKPQKLVLARTLERVALPLKQKGPWFAARVEGKSSYARCGLMVHFTAPTIHCGFDGTITLELINLGPYDINLRVGSPICQLIVERIDSRPFSNESQFQHQKRPGGQK
ncbi:dCTP deaminase [bacterium]|nr:MAG: dCTP deaminase [bacterium]